MKSSFWRTVAVVSAAVVGALIGCRAGTGPDSGVTVTVATSEPTPPVVSNGVDSQPIIECAICPRMAWKDARGRTTTPTA
jgi:hypothetical protein